VLRRGAAAVRLVGPGDGPNRRPAGAHHVRGAGGAGPHRASAGPARRLPRQPAGGDRQRRVAAAAERHLRRGHGRRLADARPARTVRPGRLPPAPGARRSGRAGLETAGRGDVGGAWSATPPRVLEGGVLGRTGPGGPLRRPARRAAGPGPLDGGPGRGARGDPRAGVERPAPVVHRDL
jgi:hypothetical protein